MSKSNRKNCSADRFIPRRANQNYDISNFLLSTSTETISTTNNLGQWSCRRYMNHAYLNYKKKVFREKLWTSLIGGPTKILNFSDSDRITVSDKNRLVTDYGWPVKPRKKPCMKSPQMVLDLPGLDNQSYSGQNKSDWGKTGFIVSIYNHEVCTWHPKTYHPIGLHTDTANLEASHVKWNRAGNKFAIATENGSIAIWDFACSKIAQQNKCSCNVCQITCIDWSMDDTHVLSGCSKGILCVWTSTLSLEKIYRAHQDAMTAISFSCGNKYFVTAGFDNTARIWHWPLQEKLEIALEKSAKSVAWHPWKESLLAIGDTTGFLTLFNINKVCQCGNRPPSDAWTADGRLSHTIDAMTWNKISGELVVSYWQNENTTSPNHTGKNGIVILSDLKTIGEEIEWHRARVPYLMWGPDDTELATAGMDEYLCVWQFLNTKKKAVRAAEPDFYFGNTIR